MIVVVLLAGCNQTIVDKSSVNTIVTDSTTEDTKTATDRYVLFTVNTQEFIYADKSVETLERIMDIHEQYNVPVDVYLTEDIARIYAATAPALVKRLKDSTLVAISYHYRPPHPYHSSAYDFLGLDTMSAEALYTTLLDYEEHATDPETGQTTDEPGGYQFVKDLFGYAPVVVGMATDRKTGDALGKIYKEKGATFIVAHGSKYSPGEERYGLLIRPETIEIIMSEYSGKNPETFIPALWKEQTDGGFMNIKVHDNDLIATQSAWLSVYLKQKPPYNLARGTENRTVLTAEEQKEWWTLYENTVRFVSENRETYTPINAFDLVKMVE